MAGTRNRRDPSDGDRALTGEEKLAAVFREESGRLTASLVRILGDFDLAEDLVQDALLVALPAVAGRRRSRRPGGLAVDGRPAPRHGP